MLCEGFSSSAALGLAIALLAPGGSPAPAPASVSRLPDVELKDLKAAPARIDLKGQKVTLVNFWATWCLPCRDEMPVISRLHAKYRTKGFRAVGVATQSGEPASVASYLGANPELSADYQMLVADDAALDRYTEVNAVPTTFLVGPDGRILRSHVGVTSDFFETLSREIDELLADHGPPPSRQ